MVQRFGAGEFVRRGAIPREAAVRCGRAGGGRLAGGLRPQTQVLAVGRAQAPPHLRPLLPHRLCGCSLGLAAQGRGRVASYDHLGRSKTSVGADPVYVGPDPDPTY